MTMRKPNYAQQMAELRNEIETTEVFMKSAVKEAEYLDKLSAQRVLTVPEYNRLQELIDYVHEKNVFLAKAKETLRSFYAPVSA